MLPKGHTSREDREDREDRDHDLLTRMARQIDDLTDKVTSIESDTHDLKDWLNEPRTSGKTDTRAKLIDEVLGGLRTAKGLLWALVCIAGSTTAAAGLWNTFKGFFR